MTNRLVITLAFILNAVLLHAQNTTVHCVRNSVTLGGYSYSTCDFVPETVTEHTLVPNFISSNYMSASTDTLMGRYFFCSGKNVYAFDVINQTVLLSYALPLLNPENFSCISFNPADSLLYGVIFTSSGLQSVNCFDPRDSSFTVLAPASGMMLQPGGTGAIDPINNVYLFQGDAGSAGAIGGFDIGLGLLSFITTVQGTAGLRFYGMAYDCSNQRIIGNYHNQIEDSTRLVSVNSLSGAVTVIGTTAWRAPALVFSVASACINHSTNRYLYMISGNKIFEVDINTGLLMNIDTIAGQQLLTIQPSTGSNCPVITSTENENRDFNSVACFPNPTKDKLTIESAFGASLEVYSSQGHLMYRGNFTNERCILNTETWASGSYFIRVINSSGTVSTRHIICE